MVQGSQYSWSANYYVCRYFMSGIASIVLFRREVDGFFKILDKDLDGKLSFSEFLGEESHIERIFKTMDKNNDGFVSKEVGKASLYKLNVI